MTAADIAEIYALESREISPWSERHLKNELGRKHGFQFVARIGTVCVGWCCARYVGDEAELLKIGVSAAYRRQGAATALFRAICSVLHRVGVHRLFLEVRSNNTTAVDFYTRNGFVEVGRRTAYYRQPEDDAVIMQCDVTKIIEDF